MGLAGAAAGPQETPGPWRVDAVVAGLVAVVFARSVGFPFVNWDDYERIVDQPWIVRPFARPLLHVLLTPELGYPQPLTVLSQAWDWLAGGGAAWPFHLTNVALHAAVAVLVRRLARAYGLSSGWSTLTALLFALHPIVVEPVCWATGRKDLLAALGVLGGFLAYRHAATAAGKSEQLQPDGRALAGLFLGFVVAIGGKPTGIVLVPLVAADLALARRRPGGVLAGALVLGAVVSVAIVVVSYHLHAGIDGLGEARSPIASLAYASQHLALQLGNLAYPLDLAPLYLESFPAPIASGWGAAGIAALAGLSAIGLGARRRLVPVAFGVIWALISFAPSSGLVPLVRGPADSYFYLPWVGLALALGALGERLANSRMEGARVVLLSGIATIVVLAGATWGAAERFSGSAALWRPMLTRYPEQPASHQNYGDGLIADGRAAQAVPHLAKALELSPRVPDTPDGMETIALACAAIGDAPCTTRWWGKVARYFPLTERRAWLLAGAAAAWPDSRYEAEIAMSRRRVLDDLRASRRGAAIDLALRSVEECRLAGAALGQVAIQDRRSAAVLSRACPTGGLRGWSAPDP